MATLGNWSFADLTGNSQFVLVGSVLYAVGNTTVGGQFAIYSSTNYGITVSNIASYQFPESPGNTEFDPAVVADANGFLHILGTRHNPGIGTLTIPTDDVVKFTFDTNYSSYLGWQATHAYTLGQKIFDMVTNTIQVVTQAGTSGGSVPLFSTAAYTTVQWAATTTYRLGDTISVTIGLVTYIFRVTVAGTSGVSVPTWPLTGTVTDGSITWLNIGTPNVTDAGVIWQSLGGALSGPFTLVQGTPTVGGAAVLIGSDYDITTLTSGGSPANTAFDTFAVVQIVDNITFQEQVKSYYISGATGLATSSQTIITSPSRGGQAYDSVSLVAPNGSVNTIEAYITSHNKAIVFTDITFTLGLFTISTTGSLVTTTLGSGGLGYVSGDTGTINGGTGGTYKVLTVGALGVVLTYQITAIGTGYSFTTETTATGGSQPGVGTGLTINNVPWTAQSVLYTLPVRHVDNRLTVIANGNKRWLSDTLYTQNRAGLSGNMFLGYLNDITTTIPWTFNLFPGTPQASLVESCINVFSDNSTALGFITRNLANNPATDGIISVNTLTVATWQYAPNPNFRNPNPFASWLRGTKSILPTTARWGFIGSQRVSPGNSIFYSGFLVPPVAAITPTAINPALRNESYSFDASASFDLNFNTIEYEWNLQISTGVPFPAWQMTHAYIVGNEILDTNGNVQICVTAGTSGSTQPLAQWEPSTTYTLGQQIVDANGFVQQVTTAGTSGTQTPSWNIQPGGTTGDNSVVWTNEGTATYFWNTQIDGLTGDGSVVWATALILVPNFVPNTRNTTATLTIGDVIGPSAQTFQVQVGVIDLDSNNNPIHTPPTGTQLAQANISLPFVPLTTISWTGNFVSAPTWTPATAYPEGFVLYDGAHMQEALNGGVSGSLIPNPWNDLGGTTTDGSITWQDLGAPVSSPASATVARNSTYTLTPTITPGQVGLPITYSWKQLFGTPVTIGASTNPTLIVETQGANFNNPLVDGLVFQITVNDDVNVPVTSVVTLNVVPYIFNETDTLVLARSNWAVAQDYTQEAHVIPAVSPFTVVVTHTPGPLQTFEDAGVNYTGGGALVFVTTPPATGQYNVYPNGQYWFSVGDANANIQISYAITQAATLAQRNTPQFWPPVNVSAMYTNMANFKRSTDLEGDTRFIVVSPASILVFGVELDSPTTLLLRRLLIPDTDLGVIEDAVHTEADYTVVLTSTNNLYRYSSAPFINTDNPDTVLNLNNYVTLAVPTPNAWQNGISYTLGDEILDSNGDVQIVIQVGVSGATQPTWNQTRFGVTNDGPFLLWKNLGPPVIFDAIFSTDTFANSRVIALSGPSGCFLMQLNSSLFTVEGFFEISVESGLVYGADNVQWIRQSNVESLHSGKILLGTLDSQGRTYETLIDLSRRVVLGTWDASKLKNQYVTTGEILFVEQSTYVGLPLPPIMSSATINTDNSVTITWTAERPDLITSYQVQISVDGGPFNLLTYIGSGIIQNYTTTPLLAGHTYAFEVRSGSADGFSQYSKPINAYVGTPVQPTLNQILNVSGPATGPFVVTMTWNQNNPDANSVTSYTVQKSVDGGNFVTLATVVGGTNQTYTDGPLAAGHTYSYQVSALYNGVTTAFSAPSSITFPAGAEVVVPTQTLVTGTHGIPYSQQLYAGIFITLPNTDTELVQYGVAPYDWSVAAGSLPPGLSLDPDFGIITGTPTTPGTYIFGVGVTDSALPVGYSSLTFPTLTIVIL